MACMVENIVEYNQDFFVEMRHVIHQLTRNNVCGMLFGTRCERSNDLLGNNFDDFFNFNIDDRVIG